MDSEKVTLLKCECNTCGGVFYVAADHKRPVSCPFCLAVFVAANIKPAKD